MLNDGFQYLEQRDATNAITHVGVVSKESAFATADNKGIFDVIAEDLRALYDDMSSLGLAKLKADVQAMYDDMRNNPEFGSTAATAQAQKAVEAAGKAEAAYNNAKATAESIEAAVDEINKIPATLAQVQSLVMQAQAAQAAAATSATNAAGSATAAANSAQGIADAEARAKAWAESSTSPNDAADADSATGKTQSSKSWALYAKDRATAAASSASTTAAAVNTHNADATAHAAGIAGKAATAGVADNAKMWDGLINDTNTENTTDTWLAVFNSGKVQHIERTTMSVGHASTADNATNADHINVTVPIDQSKAIVQAIVGENDVFRIIAGGAVNDGYVAIDTGDDGTEPIYVRQYSDGKLDAFSGDPRVATLLGKSGETSFPVSVTAPTFNGSLNGLATTASYLGDYGTSRFAVYTIDMVTGSDAARFVSIGDIHCGGNGGARICIRYHNGNGFNRHLRQQDEGELTFQLSWPGDRFTDNHYLHTHHIAICGESRTDFYVKAVDYHNYKLYANLGDNYAYGLTLEVACSINASFAVNYAVATKDSTMKIVPQDMPIPNHNAASHNAFYRGKDLTEYFDSGYMSEHIADGTFEGIYPGDYITKLITIDGTTAMTDRWLVADLDYFHNTFPGADNDATNTTHHVVLVPAYALLDTTVRMNSSNSTEGGYAASEMFTTTIPKVNTAIQNEFGTAHVFGHKEQLTNAMSASTVAMGPGWMGAPTSTGWYDVYANLMNEYQLVGAPIYGGALDAGNCQRQFAIFRHSNEDAFIRNKVTLLRTIAGANDYAGIGGYRELSTIGASFTAQYIGLRPYFCLT